MSDLVHLYETDFDPRAYYKTYYDNDERFRLDQGWIPFLHRLFAQGKLYGKTLLEVGCASTIHSVFSASRYVEDIYMSDLLEKNRNEVEKWLRGDPDAIDHSKLLKAIAELEGISDIKIIEERVRKAVKGVLPCNILNSNPLAPKSMKFDIVISSLCVDALPDRKHFFQGYKNICSLVRQGGFVVFQDAINATIYMVGDKELPSMCKDLVTAHQAISEGNVKILEVDEVHFSDNVKLPCDSEGYAYSFGVKL